jgi:hypothetical protein
MIRSSAVEFVRNWVACADAALASRNAPLQYAARTKA